MALQPIDKFCEKLDPIVKEAVTVASVGSTIGREKTLAQAYPEAGKAEHLRDLANQIRAGKPSENLEKAITSLERNGIKVLFAKDDAEAEKLIHDAHLLEEAGCFAIVLEKIPASLATRVASELTIPIIGIGAGNGVDGQVLVAQDMLGMNNGFRPRFLRRYADLHTIMTDAISHYISDVKNLDFPNEKEQY